MSMVNKITKAIAGVDKSRDAAPDSEVRQLLNECSMYEDDPLMAERYRQCADCEYLKEEFKLFGVTIKDMTPACSQCGCNLNLKIPMYNMICPVGKW